jgi:hypothetical protein
VVSFTPQSLYPQGKRPWIGGWVGPRAVLDTVVVYELGIMHLPLLAFTAFTPTHILVARIEK